MSKFLIGNIKGPKGDKGEQGATGPKGEQGIQGPEGPAGGVNSVNGMTGDVTVEQGVNLLTGTRDFSGEWVSLKEWKKENETYKGMSVYSKNSRYGGIYQKIPIKAGEKYTFSCFVKTSVNTQIGIGYDNNSEGIAYCTPIANPVNSDTEWKRVSQVFDVKSDGYGTFKVELRSEFSQEGATLYVCGYKLERGTVPNPVWTPAPEDVVMRSEGVTRKVYNTGEVSGLVEKGTIWLLVGIHYESDEYICAIAYYKQNDNNPTFKIISASSKMTIIGNIYGSVSIQYNDNASGVTLIAIKLL